MFAEVAELSRLAEDLGFDAVTFPEHHLHTEGAEMGSLPGWNPLRLALEVAWLSSTD